MQRIIEDLNKNARIRMQDPLCFYVGTDHKLIRLMKKYGERYRRTYFKRQRFTLQYETDEFYKYLKMDWFFAYASPDFFKDKGERNKEMIRLTYVLIREEMILDSDGKKIIEYYKKNYRHFYNPPFVRNYGEPYPDTVSLYLTIPKSNDIPTFTEFINISEMERENKRRKREEEENRIVERMNNNNEQKITAEELLSFIHLSKKSKARKISKRIEKYDSDGNLIETYSDRQDCLAKNTFSKSALSKHLSGKRKKLNGYIYKEVG